jgi:hypothetical protein
MRRRKLQEIIEARARTDIHSARLGEFVYLLQFEDGVKVGFTTNPVRRRTTYETPWTQPIINDFLFQHSNAAEIEREIKRRFKKYAHPKSKEFFVGLSFEELKSAISQITEKLEANECLAA